jgi:hypothetical protein
VTRRIKAVVPALVVPALLSGCGMIPGSSSGAMGGSTSDGAGSTDGPSWIVATAGSATPSPRPSHRAASPTPSAVSGFLAMGAATPAATPATPAVTCSPNTFDFSKIGGLDVTPGATSAVLSWYNVGGDNLVEFRLYATSQDVKAGRQRDVTFVTVPPRTPCGQMTGTIGNLDRRTHYVFSVDAVVTRISGDGTRAATVARSHSIPTI